MSIKVICACGKKFSAKDEFPGRKVKCPACQKVLSLSEAKVEKASLGDEWDLGGSPKDDFDDAQAEASARSRGTKQFSALGSAQLESLRATQVPLGISLVYYSLALMLLAIIGIFVAPIALSGNLVLAVRVIVALGFLIIVGSLLSLIGTGLCLTAPDEMPGKGAIFFACALNAAAVLINVVSHFTTLSRWIVAWPNLLAITGFVCFLMFLKEVAEFMGNSELTSQAEGALNLGIALIVVMVLSIVSVFVMPLAGMLLALLGAILGLVGFLRYARLLHDLRQAFARD